MCGSFIHKVSNMETTSTNHDDHDATYKQAPEIMRAVKTRKERNQVFFRLLNNVGKI